MKRLLEYKEALTSILSFVIVILGVVNSYYRNSIKQLDDVYNILSLIFLSLQSGMTLNAKRNYNKLRNNSLTNSPNYPNSNSDISI
jgi:hypothetical protein